MTGETLRETELCVVSYANHIIKPALHLLQFAKVFFAEFFLHSRKDGGARGHLRRFPRRLKKKDLRTLSPMRDVSHLHGGIHQAHANINIHYI